MSPLQPNLDQINVTQEQFRAMNLNNRLAYIRNVEKELWGLISLSRKTPETVGRINHLQSIYSSYCVL